MRKIPTIFKREESKGGHITREYFVESSAFRGAIPTEKLDGTNVRVTVRNHMVVRVEKRRNPSRLEKAKGISHPWYMDASDSSEDKWIMESVKGTDFSEIPDGEWSGEALGPNIQGNTLNLPNNRIVFFTLYQAPVFENVPITYEELAEWLPKQKSKYGVDCGIEGIVWHCLDGSMMKIKTKDFAQDYQQIQ